MLALRVEAASPIWTPAAWQMCMQRWLPAPACSSAAARVECVLTGRGGRCLQLAMHADSSFVCCRAATAAYSQMHLNVQAM